MKCITSDGKCPVAAGECDKDGECYIWACDKEQPNPNSESEAPRGEAGHPPPHSLAGSTPAAASDPADDALAAFAELVLRVAAARFVS